MNKVFLSGNLTRDPEVRYTQSGMAYAKMGIAVNRQYTSKNGDRQESTDFFNLTAWGKTAEFCGRYLEKGRRVLVEGRIGNDNYEDKNGVKHYGVNITVDNIEFASSKRSNDGESNGGGYYNKSDMESNSASNYSNSNYDNDSDDVDVPF